MKLARRGSNLNLHNVFLNDMNLAPLKHYSLLLALLYGYSFIFRQTQNLTYLFRNTKRLPDFVLKK